MADTCMRSIVTVVPFWINSEQASFEKVNVGQEDGNSAYGDTPG